MSDENCIDDLWEEYDDDDAVRQFIEGGGKVTNEHLVAAFVNGADECAALLIPAMEGFEVNTPFEVPGADFTGLKLPALYHASYKFMGKTVELLLCKKADVHYKDAEGLTAAHIAAVFSEQGDITPIMDLLRAHGANMNAKDVDGRTPEMIWRASK